MACSRVSFSSGVSEVPRSVTRLRVTQMASQGFQGLVASSESSLIMWSLPPPMVVYSIQVLYGENQRMRSSPSTLLSVVPSFQSQAGCTSAQTPRLLHISRLRFEGKLAWVMQQRRSLIGTERLTKS